MCRSPRMSSRADEDRKPPRRRRFHFAGVVPELGDDEVQPRVGVDVLFARAQPCARMARPHRRHVGRRAGGDVQRGSVFVARGDADVDFRLLIAQQYPAAGLEEGALDHRDGADPFQRRRRIRRACPRRRCESTSGSKRRMSPAGTSASISGHEAATSSTKFSARSTARPSGCRGRSAASVTAASRRCSSWLEKWLATRPSCSADSRSLSVTMPCRARAAAVAESTLANSISRRISHGREAQLAPTVRSGPSSTISRSFPWSAEGMFRSERRLCRARSVSRGEGSGAKVFDVGRQTPPGIGVERRAANLCEIAELTEESGEVRRRHPDTIRARVMSLVPWDGSQGAIRYCPHGAGTRSTGPGCPASACEARRGARAIPATGVHTGRTAGTSHRPRSSRCSRVRSRNKRSSSTYSFSTPWVITKHVV